MMDLIFATHNPNKLKEVQEMLGSDFRVKSLDDIRLFDEIPETATTLEGNALLKAAYVKEHAGFDVFADDTGLEVEALGGKPGVFSARYAGPGKKAAANMEKLLTELAGRENRSARFRTVIALLIGDQQYQFEGVVEGEISEQKSGSEGFGYDPIFIPKGFTCTFAEMTSAEKNAISHRGRAIENLVMFLHKQAGAHQISRD